MLNEQEGGHARARVRAEPAKRGGTRYPWQFFCPGGPPKRNNMQDAALSGSNVVSRQGARDLTPAARFMPRPAAPHLARRSLPILDVIKFVASGRRKIAPPPQRPLWRQSLCGLETRALALQRD
jgi:hypothetical protein